MTAALSITVLLCAVTGLTLIAKRVGVPYPVAFVLGGIALALVPGLPQVRLNPDWVFLLVLPPLLFGAAWSTDWIEFKQNARPIALLAIGLVIVTTLIVALVAHALLPALSWPLAFVLGAVVAPPDAVAAEAVLERLAVPRRLAAILSGESLVNDASALVLYRLAVAAVVFGTFSAGHALLQFVIIVLGGIAVGCAVAFAIDWFLREMRLHAVDDPTIVNVISLIAPYASYLPAEVLHVSGVLSTVTAGIYLGRRSAHVMDAAARLIGAATWRVFSFLLNGFVFIVLGLQLRGIVAALGAAHATAMQIAIDAGCISLLVIAVRIAWVFLATYVPRWISKRLQRNDPAPKARYTAIIAWTGMRGIVSLAAALAIPTVAAGDLPIAARDEMIFITFCVIFATLVVQGCTLGPLIDRLGISETSAREREETEVRIRALEAGIARLRQLESGFTEPVQWETAGRIFAEYGQRIEHLRGHLATHDGSDEPPGNAFDHYLQAEALRAEHTAILEMRAAGDVPDDVFRNIQYDLDLADVRLR